MNNETAIRMLSTRNATKEMLREALAYTLGVEYIPFRERNKDALFSVCKVAFFELYERETGLVYTFSGQDAKSLKMLIGKVGAINPKQDDDAIVATFRALIEKLPEWYKQNAFSLTVINKKFNEIVASIKQNGRKESVSSSYKQQLIDDLRS